MQLNILLLLHVKDIENYSTIKLYKFRESILLNSKKIDTHTLQHAINCIDKVLKIRYNGHSIINICNDICNIKKKIIENKLSNKNSNDLLFDYFQKIEKCEILLELSPDSLINFQEKLLKIKIIIYNLANTMKEKLLLCEF
tara:strand:+ start:198 stop:620 length:423 start_codon:yes stop_codon:yes gene_type:complete